MTTMRGSTTFRLVLILALAIILIGAVAYQVRTSDISSSMPAETATTTLEQAPAPEQDAPVAGESMPKAAGTPSIFSVTPTSGPAPLKVTLVLKIPNNNFSVDFGDGSAAWASGGVNAQSAGTCVKDQSGTCTRILSHTYTAGTYTAKLISDGKTYDTVSIYASVGTLAGFTATPSSGSRPLTVTFAGSGLGKGLQYTIDFGDSGHSGFLSTSAVANSGCSIGVSGCTYDYRISASHIYPLAGTYTATLKTSAGTNLNTVVITVR